MHNCQPNKWWFGLAPLALLWLLTNWNATPKVEADLTARATASLPSGSIDKPVVIAAGRDIGIAGAGFPA